VFQKLRCFPGAGLVRAADYFIHILNTHIFRKHSTSDSRDPFFTDCSFPFNGLNPFNSSHNWTHTSADTQIRGLLIRVCLWQIWFNLYSR